MEKVQSKAMEKVKSKQVMANVNALTFFNWAVVNTIQILYYIITITVDSCSGYKCHFRALTCFVVKCFW
jgi:uncharacterized membrane protein